MQTLIRSPKDLISNPFAVQGSLGVLPWGGVRTRTPKDLISNPEFRAFGALDRQTPDPPYPPYPKNLCSERGPVCVLCDLQTVVRVSFEHVPPVPSPHSFHVSVIRECRRVLRGEDRNLRRGICGSRSRNRSKHPHYLS